MRPDRINIKYTGIIDGHRQLCLTEEANCLILWDCDLSECDPTEFNLLRWFPVHMIDIAIEESVRAADQLRRKLCGNDAATVFTEQPRQG